jgi:hypothetical protein
MDDRETREGNVIENQCVNKTCFNTCKTAHSKVKAKDALNATIAKSSADESVKNKDTKDEKENAKDESVNLAKPIRGVDEHEQRSLAQHTFASVGDHESLAVAMALTSFINLSGCSIEEWGVSSTNLDTKIFTVCMSKSKSELDAMLDKCVKSFLESNKGLVSDHRSPVSYLLALVQTLDNKDAIARSAFVANKATFEAFRKNGIKAICEEAGFVSAFDSDEENKANKRVFTQIYNMSKGDFISEIIGFNFDWSNYTTPSLKARIK